MNYYGLKSEIVVIKAGYLGVLAVNHASFNGAGFRLAAAALHSEYNEQHNNGNYNNRKQNYKDKRSHRNSRRGGCRFAHFKLNKHYRGKRGNVH